ncbi:MAG: aminotransferase class V-fold PLP-dependent enzyme [Chthoniobacteraceae bacterium]
MVGADLREPAVDPALWPLDPEITYLNHGAFGSCPWAVLQFQQSFRERLERRPIQFLVRDLEPLLDEARTALARFVGADPHDLVFVANATAGVNTVLRSLQFSAGDELLVTNHEYNATRNAVNYIADRAGARVVVAEVPFPLTGPQEVVDAVMAKCTPRTRLAVLDHVTSQSGLVFPLEELIKQLSARGIDTLIDGAHAPGMLPLGLAALGATYYTGNCHKWLCAPKSAGFLYVQRDRQEQIRPLIISHGANSPRSDRSRFLIEFAWAGTGDPSAYLSVPEAIRYLNGLLPGGWPAIMARNHALVVAARDVLCRRLGIPPPCPDEMLGTLAALPIKDADLPYEAPLFLDPLQERLLSEHAMEVPVIPWPRSPKRVFRVSAQLYNSLPQYERLAEILAGDPVVAG